MKLIVPAPYYSRLKPSWLNIRDKQRPSLSVSILIQNRDVQSSLENTCSSKCVFIYVASQIFLALISSTGNSYIIEGSVCYLCICDQSYPRKLAFSYLEELAKEFNMSYGNEVDKPGLRPYAFVKFGKCVRVCVGSRVVFLCSVRLIFR